MSSTIIEPLATTLSQKVAVTITGGITLKGYVWEPKTFDQLPAGAVGPPVVRRTGLDEGERELGSEDWFLEFPVSLYFDLDEAVKSQGQMIEALELFTSAIDDDPSLGSALVDDCKLTNAEPFVETDRNRPLVGYLCTVAVWRRVPA